MTKKKEEEPRPHVETTVQYVTTDGEKFTDIDEAADHEVSWMIDQQVELMMKEAPFESEDAMARLRRHLRRYLVDNNGELGELCRKIWWADDDPKDYFGVKP